MSDRGMKKWNAYRALPEHDPMIKQVMNIRKKVERPILLDEEIEIINSILVNYHGEILIISVFEDDEIKQIITTLKRIDKENQKLILPDKSYIKFNDIVKIKIK